MLYTTTTTTHHNLTTQPLSPPNPPQNQDDGSYPIPPDDALVKQFSLDEFSGKWYISAGLNPLFDIFDCQVRAFWGVWKGGIVGLLGLLLRVPVYHTSLDGACQAPCAHYHLTYVHPKTHNTKQNGSNRCIFSRCRTGSSMASSTGASPSRTASSSPGAFVSPFPFTCAYAPARPIHGRGASESLEGARHLTDLPYFTPPPTGPRRPNRDTVQRFVQDPENPAIMYNHDNEYLHYQARWQTV